MPNDSTELLDGLATFEAGINAGIVFELLGKNQLANALNVTVRGSFAAARPPFYKLTFDADSLALLASALATGPFQGWCFYKPDFGPEGFVASIGGRLFFIVPDPFARTATVTEVTIPGDPNPPNDLQAWLWQSEKWVIVQQGIKNPIFFDGKTSVRSNYATSVPFSTTTTANFTIPAVGTNVVVAFTSVANVVSGDIITVQNRGTYQVLSIAALNVTMVNLTSGPVGGVVASGTTLSWIHIGTQLPPGLMGAYGLGRNWMALPDAKQFVASDLVGGSSGTQAEQYRDAVLQITENLYLAGGGNFTVPGSPGDIRAMIFATTLDVSLGQGPLQVFTPKKVFSCKAPVDRLEWQDVTNPILTESLIGGGGLGQNSTVAANGDTISRSLDGIRSLILGRRDFDTWGNVPISREVDPQLAKDSPDLLRFGSAVVFDNRLLMTCLPVLHSKGVYWRGLIPLNFDPISTLRGKAPSVYDSTLWTGLNVLQLGTGQFANIDRSYAMTLNLETGSVLELWEILKSKTPEMQGREVYDNGRDRITWVLDSPVLFNQTDPRKRMLLRLLGGEIFVDDLQGIVDFMTWYKPEQGCWEPWFAWQECAKVGRNGKPQFRPRIGLGEPSPDPCDESTGRPVREAYNFQWRLVITGHCRLLGARFMACAVPEPVFAPQSCTPICFTETVNFT